MVIMMVTDHHHHGLFVDYEVHRQGDCLRSLISWDCSVVHPTSLAAALFTDDDDESVQYQTAAAMVQSRADVIYRDYFTHL